MTGNAIYNPSSSALATSKRSVDMPCQHQYTVNQVDAIVLQALTMIHYPMILDNPIDTTGMLTGGNDMPRKWVNLGMTPEGEPIKKNLYGKTDDELNLKIAQAMAAWGRIELQPKEKTLFKKYAESWFEHHKSSITESSQITYRQGLKKHIIPYFGNLYIEEITWKDVQAWVKTMPLLSRSTVYLYKRILSMIFDMAIHEKIVSDNPAKDKFVVIPNKKETKRQAIPESKMREIVRRALLLEDEYKKILFILTYTGIRKGELLALRWEDIDFQNNLIHVRHGASLVGAATIGSTKSASGVRTIPMPDILKIIIEPLRKEGKQMVIGGKNKPICGTTFDNWMKKIREFVPEMEGITAHYFRHTFLTMLSAKGADINTVKQYAGHATCAPTMRYMHTVDENVEAAAKKTNNWLNIYEKKEWNMHAQSIG